MKKKSILITCLVGTMLMAGCGSESAVDNNSSESQTAVNVVEPETPEVSDTTEVAQTSEDAAQAQDASTATIDMKDFAHQFTEEYGGSLEKSLATALNTTADVTDDGFESTCFLCDGAIEIYGSTNGTGFYVVQKEAVANFSVFGASVGMSLDDAVAALEAQGFKEESGDTTYYAINAKDFYITMESDGGLVTKVQYVKVIEN
ncbi:MAG: hypothetical protein K6D38_09525 [Pseudobutyrivibrio sp.]|nr:hypothetical protein [Pseudobutyrivibrio sp.]